MIENKAPVRNAILTFQDSTKNISDIEIKCGGDKVKNQNNQYVAKARLQFSIEKKFDSSTPMANILIFNLNLDTVKYILQNFDIVKLEVGYNNNLGLIFRGFIKEIFYRKENDYILEIYAISNFLSKLKINISYSQNATNLEVLQKVNQALTNYGLTKINYSLADNNFLSNSFNNGTINNYVYVLSDLINHFLFQSMIDDYEFESYYDDTKDIIFITSVNNYNPDNIIVLNNEEINQYTARYWEAQNLLNSNYFNDVVYKTNSNQVALQNNNLLLSAISNATEKQQFLNEIKADIKIDSRINIGTIIKYNINNKESIYQIKKATFRGDTHLITNNWTCAISMEKIN